MQEDSRDPQMVLCCSKGSEVDPEWINKRKERRTEKLSSLTAIKLLKDKSPKATLLLLPLIMTTNLTHTHTHLTHSVAVEQERAVCQSIRLHEQIKWMNAVKVDQLLQETETEQIWSWSLKYHTGTAGQVTITTTSSFVLLCLKFRLYGLLSVDFRIPFHLLKKKDVFYCKTSS